MIEMGQILEGLVRRTEDGRLKWRRSIESNRFVTSVDVISIRIQEILAVEGYRLDILDESGEIVESLRYQDMSRDEEEQLARLYVLARRSAIDVDSTLEKLAKALEL